MFSPGLGHGVAPLAFFQIELRPFRLPKFPGRTNSKGANRNADLTTSVPENASNARSISPTLTGSVMAQSEYGGQAVTLHEDRRSHHELHVRSRRRSGRSVRSSDGCDARCPALHASPHDVVSRALPEP